MDLKPVNIFVTDDFGTVKIGDFGGVTRQGPSADSAPTSREYVPPEAKDKRSE
ncbi:hypothetical protein CCACVL1_20379 [Corchorus capsularis]|uniref:Protein kinase domain-containing protein n=1 Tax=Corchorus capsularis TaxID=210143 RepID=A0A1R3HBH3_COCAP|nr:hypothetical protein CCACVL1_20379 [Corchorus capsularis]